MDAEAFRKIAGEDHQFFNINQHGQEDCLEYLLHMLSKIEVNEVYLKRHNQAKINIFILAP